MNRKMQLLGVGELEEPQESLTDLGCERLPGLNRGMTLAEMCNSGEMEPRRDHFQ
jgi:hypothetical protein